MCVFLALSNALQLQYDMKLDHPETDSEMFGWELMVEKMFLAIC